MSAVRGPSLPADPGAGQRPWGFSLFSQRQGPGEAGDTRRLSPRSPGVRTGPQRSRAAGGVRAAPSAARQGRGSLRCVHCGGNRRSRYCYCCKAAARSGCQAQAGGPWKPLLFGLTPLVNLLLGVQHLAGKAGRPTAGAAANLQNSDSAGLLRVEKHEHWLCFLLAGAEKNCRALFLSEWL